MSKEPKQASVPASPPREATSPALAQQRRWFGSLRSRWAKLLGVGAVSIGAFVAVGHFLGGMVGWWHAYEFTFGKPHAPSATQRALAPAALSLVVLPIQNMSGDSDGDWFADALTNDLTTELGHMSGSRVISRDSALTFKGTPRDPRDVARELGVRYVVRGAVRRQDSLIRLTLALVDGESGVEHWAQQYDVERARLSSSLGEAVAQLARSLSVQVYRSAGERVAQLEPSEVQAEDLAMQGWSVYFRGVSRENLLEAQQLFEASVARDARSVRGWGGVAVVNGLLLGNLWAPDRPQAMQRLEVARQRLQALDENDIHTYFAKHFIALLNSDYESVLALATVATERFPSQPQPHFGRAVALVNLGRFDECFEPAKQAIRIGPRDPGLALWNRLIATCHFMREEYPLAVTYARAAQQINPNLQTAPLLLAASLARAGQREEALVVVAELRKRNPDAQAADVEKFLRANRNERFLEGRNRWIATLRELGLP